MKSIYFCTIAGSIITFSDCYAGAKSLTEVYDFSRNSIEFSGLYQGSPKNQKHGLAAEILARQDGISRLEKVIKTQCEGGEATQVIPQWQSSVKSQGSEIFADGSLKILLGANLSSVFRKKKESGTSLSAARSLPLTQDGKAIVFTLGPVSGNAVKCGSVKVEYQSNTTELMPTIVSPKESQYKISLLLGAGQKFKISKPEAIDVLMKSNAFDQSSQKLVLKYLPILSAKNGDDQ